MAKFYTDKSGRRRPISQSLYRPARDRVLAEHISIRNPTEAQASVDYLQRRYDRSGSRAERVKLVRAANSASNRAEVASNNHRLSVHERGQMAMVSGQYRGFVDEHKEKE